MTTAELQARLAHPYDRATWLDTLGKTLSRTEIFAAPQPVPADTTRAESIVQLGKVHLAGQRNLALLEVTVGDRVDLLRNRVGLRQLVARYIDQAEYHGVLAIFHQRDARDYRFTFAAREAALDASGQLVRHETAPRRYSYLLGPNESCRTAAERFALLAARGDRAEIKDIVEAFNVDKLNREFFADFRKAFASVVTDLLARNQDWARAEAEAESQTLLSRLLFLCFIQRKGWLNRRRDYLVTNFRRHDAEDPEGTSFYDKFLKHFFVKLASEEAFFPNIELGDLPFLNGGLFDDEMDALSGRGRIKIGNATFRQLFDHLLGAYNFTVREDTPLDQEVAIDPEMLGKIFESLVLQLEQTDAEGETSRHDTGSYYTPRPIVHHLCREGLRVWLEQFPPSPDRAADWPKQSQTLLALDASDGLDETERATLDSLLTPDEARALLDRLHTFRACDLAVGSGALLVGLLHELINLHRLCETRARGKDPADADADWLYENKKRITEPCIFIASTATNKQQPITALKWDESHKPENVNSVVQQSAADIHQSQLQDDGWHLEPPAVLGLLDKMRQASKPLGELVAGRFFYGIKTGLNEAFVIDRTTRDRLIAEHRASSEIIKPFLRGRDVKRWRVAHQDLWLIFTRRGIDINKYPAIYEHLKPFKNKLTPGVAGGRKPGSYEWYEIQDNIAYWQEFETPKIVYQDIARYFGMSWDDTNSYLANTCYFIPRAEKWLLGLLLSSPMAFYVQKVLGSDEGGFIRLFSIYVEKFPIPAPNEAERSALEGLVEKCLAARGENCGPWESEINDRVYRLYGLNRDDIKMVEDSAK